jgi:hypothetical protein
MDKPCQKPSSGKGKRKPAPEQHFPGKQRFKNLHNSLAALFNLPGISESPDVTARKKDKDSDLSVSILKIRHAAIIPAYSRHAPIHGVLLRSGLHAMPLCILHYSANGSPEIRNKFTESKRTGLHGTSVASTSVARAANMNQVCQK